LKTRTGLIGLSDTLDTTRTELIPLVKEFGFEGVIAKRKDSSYESGKRSGAWVKYKVNKAQFAARIPESREHKSLLVRFYL
jgi:ATP-dependent DNA ligase